MACRVCHIFCSLATPSISIFPALAKHMQAVESSRKLILKGSYGNKRRSQPSKATQKIGGLGSRSKEQKSSRNVTCMTNNTFENSFKGHEELHHYSLELISLSHFLFPFLSGWTSRWVLVCSKHWPVSIPVMCELRVC